VRVPGRGVRSWLAIGAPLLAFTFLRAKLFFQNPSRGAPRPLASCVGRHLRANIPHHVVRCIPARAPTHGRPSLSVGRGQAANANVPFPTHCVGRGLLRRKHKDDPSKRRDQHVSKSPRSPQSVPDHHVHYRRRNEVHEPRTPAGVTLEFVWKRAK
jgi:hypothetical protein